jgi:diguanylate cyclase (GGDEF)-like protein/putative nucleotidyltransferase with HDIG domain
VVAVGVLATAAPIALQVGGATPAAVQVAFGVLVTLAVAVTFAGARARAAERAIWPIVGATLAFNALCEVGAGWSQIVGGGPWGAISVAAGVMVVPLAIASLLLLLRERVGRLRAVASLDGLTLALVVQTLIALALLGPVEHALADRGFTASITLLYPLADLLVVGVVGAAAAQHGWRPDSWSWLLLGLIAMTAGDAAQVGDVVRATGPGGAANVAWLAGSWLIAAGAWARVPPKLAAVDPRNWVPIASSVLALALLIVTATRSADHPLALALAAAALAAVLARFALTLRANARMLRDARREAMTDALTGLPNRRRLTLDLEARITRRGGTTCGLALYDLNGFKDYNDTYGHAAGDALLITLSEKLQAAVDGRGVAYRMGGDEFCVLVECANEEPAAVASRAAFALDLGTQGFEVNAAHGLVLLPSEADNASDALRLADMRMYEDKERRRMGPRRQATRALMQALAERDAGLHEHLEGVQMLATEVALRLGLDPAEVERVRLGALLHDVGKIAIPDSILHKPGPLSEAEWTLMHRHTLIGQRILERAPALADVAELVRSSHERFDGGGYPDGLAGAAIPIGARIIAVCDAYDAMVSTRSYRAALRGEDALAELRRCAGVQFDAGVVERFVAAVRERDYPADTESTGGSRVAASNHVAPASPVPNTSPEVAPK